MQLANRPWRHRGVRSRFQASGKTFIVRKNTTLNCARPRMTHSLLSTAHFIARATGRKRHRSVCALRRAAGGPVKNERTMKTLSNPAVVFEWLPKVRLPFSSCFPAIDVKTGPKSSPIRAHCNEPQHKLKARDHNRPRRYANLHYK